MAKKKYKLMFNEAFADYKGDDKVEIGKVVDTDSNEDIMLIGYDKNLYFNNGYHLCVNVYIDENNGNDLVVAEVDDMHRDCLYNNPDVFLAMMLHEYAHYINGDLAVNTTNQKIQNERMRCILENRVMSIELKADAFAISHVGKNTFMRSIDYLINTRKRRGDKDMQLAIKEFELRKKAARNLR